MGKGELGGRVVGARRRARVDVAYPADAHAEYGDRRCHLPGLHLQLYDVGGAGLRGHLRRKKKVK